MTDHVGELAELYAIGSLEEFERERVERHVSQCRECAAQLRDAEETVSALAQAQTRDLREPPAELRARLDRSIATRRPVLTWHPFAAGIAAAIILAFIPTWVAVDRNSALVAMRQDERALARLASAGTQIDHAQFMLPSKQPMDAKVLYGPRGDWYYVVVMHPRAGMQVAYVHGGQMEMLGRVAMHGESGTLYLPVNHKMEQLALCEGNTVVAEAHLVY
ncbi:MAG TPA: hypothetical protein VKT72_07460 [Candidatus Baltobacteraceae bacterium]|nr:hypothetical protein [Candidatus Baltobacteraceae bacterium]